MLIITIQGDDDGYLVITRIGHDNDDDAYLMII